MLLIGIIASNNNTFNEDVSIMNFFYIHFPLIYNSENDFMDLQTPNVSLKRKVKWRHVC